jgi:hypothetical protein
MIHRLRLWWLFKRMDWCLWWNMARFSHPLLGLMSWLGK